ncbi:MAG: type III pantothenate kinase [Lachnospiraceae bacterium]|nr:type III pantothenate kinase [Lachnospiraceae bacterium]
MILAADVGNTNITVGAYDGEKLCTTFRLTTKTPRTSDEYGILIREILSEHGIKKENIEGSIISSVVPDVMHALVSSLKKYFGAAPVIVGPGIKSGMKIITEEPKSIGADRIVDAVAGYEKYGGPVLIIDFGTATTYDLVNEKGEFAAGITAPGIRISAEALWKQTAKLPNIEIKLPKSILAQETVSSMQAGLMYGQVGATEYIIDRVKSESGIKKMKVVATGGLGRLIADATDSIDIYDANLTLEGLRIIYDKNKAVKNR